MAARKDRVNLEVTRLKIQTTQLVNRLQNHAKGQIEMTPTQVKATEILLKKSLPDLSQVSLSNTDGQPFIVRWAGE